MANTSVFPDVDQVIVGDQGDVGNLVPLTERSNVVIVTHGHTFDKDALRSVVHSRAGYVGMIGSRSKVRTVISQLEEEGVDHVALSRVYTPIGLDIGGQTPAEIAISILAEIIAVEHDKIDSSRSLTNLRKVDRGE